MADKLISTLTAATTIADADWVVIETAAGNSRKVSGANAKAALVGAVTPQGRLTLVSATPVMVSDQTAKTTVYYAEYTGNMISIYDGTNSKLYTFNNLSAILDVTHHLLENLYDVYAYLDTTAKIGFSPAWVNTATVTWTSASPGVCTWTNHGLSEGAPVIFTAGTSTPTGITAGTTYYVSKTGLAASAFSISTSVANAAAGTNINTSSTGTGTQTGTNHTTIRGTGAGTTELELKNGLWTNKNAIVLYNNNVASSSISANQATYLGTLYCTANGQTGMAFKPAAAGGGSAPILGLFNAYNRVLIGSVELDSTASWNYAVTTWRASNGNVANRISYVDGLAMATVIGTLIQTTQSATTSAAAFGVGRNSTATAPTVNAQMGNAAQAFLAIANVSEIFTPSLGFNYLTGMEKALAGTQTIYGAAPGYALTASLEI